MEILNQIFVLFLLLMIGYAGKKIKLLSNQMNNDLSNFILYIALPSLMIISLSSFEYSRDMLYKSVGLIIISVVIYALSIGISYMAAGLLNMKGTTRDIFQFMVVFSNVGFMGYPVANAVYGSEGIFYAAIYNLPFNVLLWTFGIMVMSRPLRNRGSNPLVNERGSLNLKMLLNPGITSVFIGFAMFLTSTKLPGPIHLALEMLGNTTTPLSMLFAGSILADMKAKEVFTNKHVMVGSFIKLMLLPLLVLVLLKSLATDEIMIGIPVVITAMPTATNCAIFATKYGNDYHMGSQAVFITTLLAMLTIPLIVILL